MTLELDRGDGTGSSPSSVVTVLEGMRAVGIDIAAVCAAADCSLADLEAREVPVPSAQIAAMWTEAARLYGQGPIGIAVGMAAPTGRNVVDYVASTSPTFRIALEQIGRYHRLITRNGDMRLRSQGGHVLFELLLNLPTAAIPSPVIEFALTCVVRRAVDFTDRKALEVWFPHGPLGSRDEYARVLGVAPRFEAPHAGVLFDDATLDAPCRASDPNLFKLLKSHAELLLAREPRDNSVRSQVRRLVITRVKDGEPDIANIARLLASSERSLQRQLKIEGTSFRAVVDEARRELALGYLDDHKLTVSEVGYLLGYAEAGAFVRAFKRWTGRTPGEVRRT